MLKVLGIVDSQVVFKITTSISNYKLFSAGTVQPYLGLDALAVVFQQLVLCEEQFIRFSTTSFKVESRSYRKSLFDICYVIIHFQLIKESLISRNWQFKALQTAISSWRSWTVFGIGIFWIGNFGFFFVYNKMLDYIRFLVHAVFLISIKFTFRQVFSPITSLF
jgi:hypothetical protein